MPVGKIVFGTLVMALLLVVVVVIIVAIAGAVTGRRPSPAPSRAAEVARRHGATVNALAWIAAAVLGQVPMMAAALLVVRATAGNAPYGAILTGLYPTVPALVFLGVHALGERTWPRPGGAVRRAALAPREPVAPRWLLRVTIGWGAALVVALITTGATSSDGRWLAVAADGTTNLYPGWYYGVPLLVGAALIGVTTRGVLHLVARRPAVVDADPAYDAASRRLSVHRVLRGVQLVLALMVAGVLVVAGAATWNSGPQTLGTLLLVLGAAAVFAGFVIALVPGRAPQPAGGPAPSDTPPAQPQPWPVPSSEAPGSPR